LAWAEAGDDYVVEQFFGAPAVAGDQEDGAMGVEEGSDLVGNDGIGPDGRVEAAGAVGGMADIPKGNAGLAQDVQAPLVGERWVGAVELTHDPPEAVLRLGVVLTLAQGFSAGEAAEDQDACIWGSDGRESGAEPNRFFNR
jgi:hypothetical protein